MNKSSGDPTYRAWLEAARREAREAAEAVNVLRVVDAARKAQGLLARLWAALRGEAGDTVPGVRVTVMYTPADDAAGAAVDRPPARAEDGLRLYRQPRRSVTDVSEPAGSE